MRPLIGSLIAAVLAVGAVIKIEAIKSAYNWATGLFDRPKLKIEIRQLCQNRTLDSLTNDLSGFTVDILVFLYLWVVNTSGVSTTLKSWEVTMTGDHQQVGGSPVYPITQFIQIIKHKELLHGMTVEKTTRLPLVPVFPSEVFVRGVPLEGWVCFKVSGVGHSFIDNAVVRLTLVDSFGKHHRLESHGPWQCRGEIVNPDLP